MGVGRDTNGPQKGVNVLQTGHQIIVSVLSRGCKFNRVLQLEPLSSSLGLVFALKIEVYFLLFALEARSLSW